MEKAVWWTLGIIGLGVWTDLVIRIVRYIEESDRKQRRKTISTSTEDEINVEELPPPDNLAIFFPDKKWSCPNLVDGKVECLMNNCPFLHQSNFLTLLKVLRSAKKSLDLCIYVLTFNDLANVLIDMNRHNIKVRVIVDGREKEAASSKIFKIRNRGVNVRLSPHSHTRIMHNKFAIIDGEKLVNGSFNWTKGAILNNYDNIMVTSDSRMVREYQHRFESLWEAFGKAKTDKEAEDLLFLSE